MAARPAVGDGAAPEMEKKLSLLSHSLGLNPKRKKEKKTI
jgi:hypothetical protein